MAWNYRFCYLAIAVFGEKPHKEVELLFCDQFPLIIASRGFSLLYKSLQSLYYIRENRRNRVVSQVMIPKAYFVISSPERRNLNNIFNGI